ncbi:hypothetical protein C8J57DRAFT_1342700 [Mycena rebaudengoi]|nr:hypothetical protein C8J57DRAFT_1342700 [Mycena rebaudengoi]
MTGQCLEIQEICNLIIDHLHDPLALHSCALVSSRFVSRCQSHLFRCIDLELYYKRWAINRLESVLAASPHILRYIRRLVVRDYDEEDTYRRVALIPWSHLESLSICCGGPSDLVLEQMCILAALPTVRELSFPITWSPASLWQLLTHCTPTLDTIEVVGYFSEPPLPLPNVPLPPAFQRPKICRLRIVFLSQEPFVGGTLLAPNCPLDLSSLTHLHLQVDEYQSPSFRILTMKTRMTLTSIHVSEIYDGLEPALDLNDFPALTIFRSTGWGLRCETLLSRLTAPNHIHTIRVDTTWMDGAPSVLAKSLETSILKCRLPQLRSVVIGFHKDLGQMQAIRDCVPQLCARAFLSFEYLP